MRSRMHLAAKDETRPLACFAGIWTNWTSVRKVNEGETTNDIFVFLTTPDEVEAWMTDPPDEALTLQRPLPDGSLRLVAYGVKEDPAGTMT
jgi:putative SOS response-associated peptidase YedK